MLFQFGALFTDLSVFENVAFPLREHTRLNPAMVRDLVLMKLNAVGLRGARDLMPSEISGGMARRVALARAISLDPDLIMYDEPFAGLDPISLGMAARLIRELNDALGVTSIVVSHDVDETFAIADHVVFIANGGLVAQGTPQQMRDSEDPLVHQFFNAEPEGPVHFHYPADDAASDYGVRRVAVLMLGMAESGEHRLRDSLQAGRLGLRRAPVRAPRLAQWSDAAPNRAGRRPAFLRRQPVAVDHRRLRSVRRLRAGAAGLLHLAALRLGGGGRACWWRLSLTRELGPVVTALLFAGRAGTSLTAEIGLMKAGEQLAAMEMMAVDPVLRVLGPRFWAGIVAMPLLAAVFSAVGILGGWAVAVPLARHRCRLVLVADAGRGRRLGRYRQWRDQECGVRRDRHFRRAAAGFCLQADARRRVAGDHTHRRDGVAGRAGTRFRADGDDVFDLKELTMQQSRHDVWVGLFVMIGAAALLFLALKAGNLLNLSFAETYPVTARFDNIGGLKVNAAVKSAGVVVGRVESIGFDGKTFQASVLLKLEKRFSFPKDTAAKILTSGLLGEQYIGLDVGGDVKNLAAGDRNHPDPVCGGAGESDQPVSLQQGGRCRWHAAAGASAEGTK